MSYADLGIEIDQHIAVVEIQRPPNNFFDVALIENLADAFFELDDNPEVRAAVLCSAGKHFCAGNDFSKPSSEPPERQIREKRNPLYEAAIRLFDAKTPVVAAVQGAAVGGGFGLALMPDFRVVTPEARFTANFVKLGFHPGFALTYTLPRLVGQQQANLLFLTGRRIGGDEAHRIGIADVLSTQDKVREDAIALAAEIAENAPLAIRSIRATMRGDIAEMVKRHTDREHEEQYRLRQTEDHQEGVRAVAERRVGNFTGR